MAKDIEDFLKRAAERRRQQQAKKQPAPPPPPPRQSLPSRNQPPLVIDDIEIVEDNYNRGSGMRQQSVQEHVQQYMDTSDIASHAENLGQRISNVARQVDQRVHDHLDHDISKIDDTPTITDDALPPAGGRVNPVAADLRRMLSNPQAVGRSIFLAEILKRPEWD